MHREIRQKDPEIGFTWVESEGEYYTRNPNGDLKRLSADGLTFLQELANGTLSPDDLSETAEQLVEQLKTENYLRDDTPVVELIPPDDIKLWPRLLIFFVLGGVSVFATVLELSAPGASESLFTPLRLVLLGIMTFSIIAIHECGHYLASKQYINPTIRVGTVNGIIPAAITETTGAWMLPRNRRLWIHLAGPFLHLVWLQAILVVHYLLVPQSVVLDFVVLLATFSALFSFNPLIHGDGYWFLSDWFNIVGLRRRGITDLQNHELTRAAGYVLVSYAYAGVVMLGSVVSAAYFFGLLGHL